MTGRSWETKPCPVSWASSVEVDTAGSKIEALEGQEWTSAFSISLARRAHVALRELCYRQGDLFDQGGLLAMASTRRLAAILAADVAGYSRLMGADEEGTHERLKAHLSELVQ